MKLYQISEQYQNIAELLLNPEFHENEDIVTALDAIQDDFNDKAVNTVMAIKMAEGDIGVIDTEIKRLQEMKKVRQNKVERVRNYLKTNMARTGILKIECPLFKISYSERKNGVVEIDDALFLANNLNDDLIKIEIKPSKDAIKKALKNGEDIVGAKLVDSQVLMIK